MPKIDIALHYQQTVAFNSTATEMLYGGAAGGGKSHLMRAAAILWCLEIKGLQVFLFRRLSDDLVKNHMIGAGGFYELLEDYLTSGVARYNASKNYIQFYNGSRIWLCHCQYEKDMYKYQGSEIHVLMIDELTHFSEKIYRYLRGRCRLGGLSIPPKYKSLFPRILCGSNPGNVGHTWVRRSFVNNGAPLSITTMPSKEGGMKRQFIPALLDDNPTLKESDPDYLEKLEGLGDPALVKAMSTGDWDIVAGGAIDDLWDVNKHRIQRFPVPSNWYVDRSFDWGSTAPFSVGWWAEANGEEVELPNGETFCPPKGSIIRIGEWYATEELGTNKGLKMGSLEVAEGIKIREANMLQNNWVTKYPEPGPADNSIFSTDDKSIDSISEQMRKKGVRWTKSDKSKGSRKSGLQLLRDRLKNTKNNNGLPGIYFMDNCKATFELLPVLPRDEKDLDDVDTAAEDHIYDEIRYKCLDLKVSYVKRLNVRLSV